jgi:hypothetical protein
VKRSIRTTAALGLLLLGGCGLDGGGGAASLEPRADLAQKAVLAAANHTPGRPASRGGSPVTANSRQRPAKDEGDELARVRDGRADHGDGPGYADLTEVTFTDSEQGLVVSVALRSFVPGRLARREIQDVGVDLYRVSPLEAVLGQTDSDYQVRLRGGASGWRAHLRTPEGYVAFPGTFTVGDRSLRVLLPWEAVGGRERAIADVFVDWSSGVGRLATDGVPRVRLWPK